MSSSSRHLVLRAGFSALCLLLLAATAFGAGSKPKKEKEKTPVAAAFEMGAEQMKSGDFEAAVASFKKAVALDEGYAEAHNNLAYSLRKAGEAHHDDALKHYNKAIELKPELAQAYHYRGILHVLAGDEAAAKADHDSLLKLDRELADELMKVIASGEEPEGDHGAVWK